MRKPKKLTLKSHYNKFIGSLIKKGNKVAARNILTSAIKNIWRNISLKQREEKKKKNQKIQKGQRKVDIEIDTILSSAFKDLKTHVEIKKIVRGVKRKMRITWIPFPLSRKRQTFLKIKWIIQAARENRKKIAFSEKLSDELWNLIFDKRKSKALSKKLETRKLILANKSNSHYRW